MERNRVEVEASAVIAARSEEVYAVVADYRVGHPAFLPPRNFHLEVEEGGYGAGTVFRFVSRVMGVERTFHMQVSEPEPGRVLVERETGGSLATTWTFTPVDDGRQVRLTIRTETDAGVGLRGAMERFVVPRALREVYREELNRLAAVVRGGDAMKVNVGLLVFELVATVLIVAAALFLTAGTVAWNAGWLFLALFSGYVFALPAWLVRRDPALVRERMRLSSDDQKPWDKVFVALINVGFLAWLVVMPLEAVRFRWSHVPVWVQGAGAVLLVAAFGLFFTVFRENTFLSPLVRVQRERGQTVVTTGPYRYVRHPMYAGFLAFAVGTPLLLGSWYGLVVSFALVALAGWRAVREEHALRDELPGYRAYMAHTRYRFVPGVW